MRRLFKICLVFLGVLLLIPVFALGWLFFDSHGLPDIEPLGSFAPTSPTRVTDACLTTLTPGIIAVPYDAIGANLRKALRVAEGSENDPGLLESYYLLFTADYRRKLPRAGLSYLVFRTMCPGFTGRTLQFKLDSLRLSAQLERRYSRRQLFTIFANRLYFGEGQFGVRAASLHYFGKEPNELSIAEAALLVAILRAPTRYSPRLHPDLANERRNRVIDDIIAAHAITESEGTLAKASPVSILAIDPTKP